MEPAETAVVADLADDVADIYRDLKEALLVLDGGAKTEAQWNIRFSFLNHWGRHASSAISALHNWLADQQTL